jgi:hypothetical protein
MIQMLSKRIFLKQKDKQYWLTIQLITKKYEFIVFIGTAFVSSVFIMLVVISVKTLNLSSELNRPVTSHCQTLSHNVVSSTPRHELGSNSQL